MFSLKTNRPNPSSAVASRLPLPSLRAAVTTRPMSRPRTVSGTKTLTIRITLMPGVRSEVSCGTATTNTIQLR